MWWETESKTLILSYFNQVKAIANKNIFYDASKNMLDTSIDLCFTIVKNEMAARVSNANVTPSPTWGLLTWTHSSHI